MIQDYSTYLLNHTGSAWVKTRFESSFSQLYLIAIVILIGGYILIHLLSLIFEDFFTAISGSCKSESSRESSYRKRSSKYYSNDILKELKISQLIELYKRCNKDLDDFKEMLDIEAFDKSKLSKEQATDYLHKLNERITNIQTIIDEHISIFI